MINIYPHDFVWPDTKTQDYKQLPYGEYLIQDIIDVIQNDFQVGSPIYIYGEQQCQTLLQGHSTMIEYGIDVNCVLFARKTLCLDNLISIQITIDNKISDHIIQAETSTLINEIIFSLMESQFITQQILRLQLLNLNNGQLLTTDYGMEFNQFLPLKQFELKLYTQQETDNNITKVTETNKIPQDNNNQAKDLLKQLIVFPKFSILVDEDCEFVVYKYHHPLSIKGFLAKQNGRKMKIDDSDYDFQSIRNIKYSQIDDYGLIIKWENQLYSKIRIHQQG